MNQEDLTKYVTQSLNMVLGSDGASSYTNSFTVKIRKDGVLVIPRLPAGYLIDTNFYQKIYKVLNIALYPSFTMLKQNSIYLVPLNSKDIHINRALFFPWVKGIPRRLVIPSLETFIEEVSNNVIPLMENYQIDYGKTVGIAIAGSSGSGKSTALVYILECVYRLLRKNENPLSNLTIIDPKIDTPSRWARQREIRCIYPTENRSKDDFLSQVNSELDRLLKLILKRQKLLYDNPRRQFSRVTLVIDEVASLTEGVSKNVKNDFFALLSQVCLLMRSANVCLVLVAQRFDYSVIPVSCREQLSVNIQLGKISKKTTAFLFDDLDPDGIIIPSGKGTGLIQVNDNEHPTQVFPLLMPTYYMKGNIL